MTRIFFASGARLQLRALQQTSDEDVQNLQSQLVELQSARQALDDNLASAKSTWESAEEPALDGGAASSVAKYLLIGFLLGGVLACGVVVVKFLLDGMVAVAAHDAVGNRLERRTRVFHCATRADKANDLVVVHRVTKRHDFLTLNAIVFHELLDSRRLRHTRLHGIDPRVARRRKSKELTKFAL